jgi:hypothetical protein
MWQLGKLTLGAVLGVGMLAASTAGSLAEIACSGSVCWHVPERYEYPPEARIVIHPDGWRWGPREHYYWREHEGRGYWRGRRWMEW